METSVLPEYMFGLSEFTTKPWSFAEDVECYSSLGLGAIEVCDDKISNGHAADQVARAQDAGLIVSSVQPSVRTLFPSRSQPTPKAVGERVERFRETITRLAPRVPGVPFITNTGPPPGGNVQKALDIAVQEYQALADFAGEHGVKVALEPLNATIMNIETALWTLAQARDVARAVDRDNFGLCLDFWNVWQNPDIEAHIRASGDKIYIVQASDWRTPRSFEDRLVPGRGEIPLPALLRAAHDSGYRGPYVVEIFSGGVPNSLWSGDLTQLVHECRDGFELAWQQAFSAAE